MNSSRPRLMIGITLLLGIGAFLYLVFPMILLQEINRRLQSVPGYSGEVKSLDLGWVRGRVALQGVRFAKQERTAPGAVLSADTLVADISWLQLLRGRIVADLDVNHADLLFLMRERRVGQVKPQGVWRKPFEKVHPFRMDHVAFHDSRLHFINNDALPPIDVFFDQMNVSATNLTNDRRLLRPARTHLEGTARMQNQAPLELTMDVDAFAEHASFELEGSLKEFELSAMNPIMRYYTGMKLEKGTLNMTVHQKIREGTFQGTVHRWIEDLAIHKSQSKPLKRLKEGVVQAWINSKKDDDTGQIQKKFEYSGPLGYLDQDIVLAAVWVAKGAFIQALNPKGKDKIQTIDPAEALDQWAVFQEKERAKAQKK